MIIVISGSVGAGKTSVANKLGEKLDYEVISLSNWAQKYKISYDNEFETFDFDIDKMLEEVEEYLKENRDKNLILESHFAHFIKQEFVDLLIIINRDLKELKNVYLEREYNEDKISENLEVESFNLCFYEAEEEGYDEDKVFCIDNNQELDELVDKIMKKVLKY